MNPNGGKPRHHILSTDIWHENFEAFTRSRAISLDERARSYNEYASSLDERAISPGEIKKIPPEEKPTKKTHTQRLRAGGASAAVVGGSKFSLPECRRDAEHLHSTGQGINNPGGFARTIHESGSEDEMIALFLAKLETARVESGELPAPRMPAQVPSLFRQRHGNRAG